MIRCIKHLWTGFISVAPIPLIGALVLFLACGAVDLLRML